MARISQPLAVLIVFFMVSPPLLLFADSRSPLVVVAHFIPALVAAFTNESRRGACRRAARPATLKTLTSRCCTALLAHLLIATSWLLYGAAYLLSLMCDTPAATPASAPKESARRRRRAQQAAASPPPPAPPAAEPAAAPEPKGAAATTTKDAATKDAAIQEWLDAAAADEAAAAPAPCADACPAAAPPCHPATATVADPDTKAADRDVQPPSAGAKITPPAALPAIRCRPASEDGAPAAPATPGAADGRASSCGGSWSSGPSFGARSRLSASSADYSSPFAAPAAQEPEARTDDVPWPADLAKPSRALVSALKQRFAATPGAVDVRPPRPQPAVDFYACKDGACSLPQSPRTPTASAPGAGRCRITCNAAPARAAF
ncbi:MAG: hypothetical protein J3K34DRAFT_194767 [Monoraphidium minutum]|nr:MAG: hypothetical protein J3K34DRAFT_194767 [Monoraphidium minutum]